MTEEELGEVLVDYNEEDIVATFEEEAIEADAGIVEGQGEVLSIEEWVEELKVDPDVEIIPPADKFLDLNEADFVDEASAAAAAASSLPINEGSNLEQPLDQAKDGGLGVGGMMAILIFASILLYIFRKCKEMDGRRMSGGKRQLSDHLSTLL